MKKKTPRVGKAPNLELSPSSILCLLDLSFSQHQDKLRWSQKKKIEL
jgi:hypothetical protein